MAFWAIKGECPQSLTFPLPLNTSNLFSCMAFFKLQLIIPAVFLNILWSRSSTASHAVALQSSSFRDAALFYMFPLPPAPNLPSPLLFFFFFRRKVRKLLFSGNESLNKYMCCIISDGPMHKEVGGDGRMISSWQLCCKQTSFPVNNFSIQHCGVSPCLSGNYSLVFSVIITNDCFI